MDIDIKTAVEKSNQTVEWLGDIWHNGTWTVDRAFTITVYSAACF
jgi:hypothetical protein